MQAIRTTRAQSETIAVCLAGFSPAVVTETLYALAVLRRPRILPREVHIITTRDAYPDLVATLVGPGGAISRLAREYGLPAGVLTCGREHVHVLRDRRGKPLTDIRSSAESEAAGEGIAALLGALRGGGRVELHCSLAGGRKTMGALMALALQLISRPGDRLYHVLVNEPFERIPEFLYPPKRRSRFLLDGKAVDSRTARIELAEIPLIRLGVVSESLGLGAEGLARRAAAIAAAMDRGFPDSLPEIRVGGHGLVIGETVLHLEPQEATLFRLYAQRRADCQVCSKSRARGCPSCHLTDAEIFREARGWLLRTYRMIRPTGGDRLEAILARSSGSVSGVEDFHAWLRQTRSRIRRKLLRSPLAPGITAACRIGEATDGESGVRRRGLTAPPGALRILPIPEIEEEDE